MAVPTAGIVSIPKHVQMERVLDILHACRIKRELVTYSAEEA